MRLKSVILVLGLAVGCASVGGVYRAAGRGDEKAVLGYLEKGVDPDARNFRGDTPLHYAAASQRKEVVELLITNKADVKAKNDEGDTPLHWLVGDQYETTPGCVRCYGRIQTPQTVAIMLIENGADVDARNNLGQTSLHIAARRAFDSVAEVLIGRGADVNARDNLGKTPLSVAEGNGHVPTAELLKQHGGIR